MRAAIYSRVSTDDQADRAKPIADQIGACRAYANEHHYRIAGEYSDPGISGAYGPGKRPGLAALLRDAGQAWEALLLWDESRLARDLDLSGHLHYLLREAGVTVIAVSAPDASRLEGGIRRVLADEQRERIRQDVRRAVRATRMAGGYHGGPQLKGFRWIGTGKDARMEVDPVGADRVRRIYGAALQGESIAAIGRDHGMHRALVIRTLRHPAYAGGYRRPDGELLWNHHEPIIPRHEWDRVQARLDDQAGRMGQHPRIGRLPLSGLLRCVKCGRQLQARSTHRLRSGATWYYVCPEHRSIRRAIPERFVGTLLRAALGWLSDPDTHRAIADAWNAAQTAGERPGAIRAEIRHAETQIRRLEEAIASGHVQDVAGLARRLGEAQEALRVAQARLRIAGQRLPLVTPAAVAARLREMTDSPPACSRDTLRALISHVEVGPADPLLAFPCDPLARLAPSACLWYQLRKPIPVSVAA